MRQQYGSPTGVAKARQITPTGIGRQGHHESDDRREHNLQ
jgi:hypothetical protein